MTDVHRLRHIGRTEINNDRARLFRPLIEEMFTACGCLQHTLQSRGFDPEIKKAGPGDFGALAPRADIQLREHVSGKLAWVQLSLFRQRHQDVGLIIAESRIRTWSNESECGV